jgi:hypothetical protein
VPALFDTVGNAWDTPDPLHLHMKAKVLLPNRTVHNVPREVGEIVEVDANTLENLVRKGVLAAVESPASEPAQEESASEENSEAEAKPKGKAAKKK